MSQPPYPPGSLEEKALHKVKNALRLVCASLPHLSGLASAVRVYIDDRVPTAAIAATGRLLANPHWVTELDNSEATFVMAHELLHLCLRTHERGIGTDDEVFNWAHDYIINDMMAVELERPVPKNGLEFAGARLLSAEKIVTMMKGGHLPSPKPMPRSDWRIALEEAGLATPITRNYGPGTNDIISPRMERDLFPNANPAEDERMRQKIRKIAAKALSLGLMKKRLDDIPKPAQPPEEEEIHDAMMDALKRWYNTPWEMALQQWMEAVAPGPRTYVRPSRRGADTPDVVLPGRKREGWTLHIVLDTSGSMVDELPRMLGALASFCENIGVTMIHILQCDVTVTKDEYVDPEELARYHIAGMGGSDMSPALLQLAKDPEVEAVLVLTDGAIDIPAEPMPYRVLWVLTEAYDSFRPSYGHVIVLPKD